jgi:glycosyltransferase involved in cell wall biosynthesis
MLPKVSIIIPVFNGSVYLREAIDSALAQTYSNVEILIVNDGSNDDGKTEEIAKSYGDRIRYFSKTNEGVASALNMGISHMDGEYFSWLSHDDLYSPEKIAREVHCISETASPNTVVFSGYSVIDGNGSVIEEKHSIPKNIAESVACLLALDVENTLNGCTMLIQASLFQVVGRFREDLRYAQDYDLWDRLSRVAPFVYLDEPLLLSRRHINQGGQTGGERCLNESDQLHYRLIHQLNTECLDRYLLGETNKLAGLEQIYRLSGFIKTPYAIKNLILRYSFYQNDKARGKEIMESFGILPDSRTWTSLLSHPKVRPVILTYSNVWLRGGIERVCSLLFNRFHTEYQMILVTSDIRDKAGYPLPSNLLHIEIAPRQDLSSQLAEISCFFGTDILIGNPNIMLDFLLVYEKLNRLGIRSIMLNHYDYFLPYRMQFLNNIIEARQLAMDHCTVSLWVNSFSAAMCATRHSNTGVMPNANVFEVTHARTTYDKTVILVGRFYDYVKRIDRALDVFRNVYTMDSSIRFIVIGEYDPQMCCPDYEGITVAQLIEELSFPKGILTFAGECDEERLTAYYKRAGVLLQSSDSEGFPLVLNEAAAFGVPAVVFYYFSIDDIITNGVNGYVVEQDDKVSAAKAIVSLLNDSEKWQQMSRNAQHFAERFNQDIVLKRWMALFKTLLKDPLPAIPMLINDLGLSPDRQISNGVLGKIAAMYEKISTVQVLNGVLGETATIHKINISVQDNHHNDSYQLYSSHSWRVTKPLRAFQNARKNRITLLSRCGYFLMYMKSRVFDKQSDAEILRSHCWRITAPLRRFARPFRKNQ